METASYPPARDDELAAALADYLRQWDAGRPPDLDALIARHPDLAEELRAFAENHRRLEPLARPLQTLLDPAAEGPANPPVPRRLGKYEILGKIAQGGMGVVYRARQPGLDRLVAIKVIRSGDLATAEQVERFVAEARSLARLQHPNIVHVYEVGTHDGLPFFALEYVEGGSLERRTRREPQPVADAVRLVEVLARAVQHAHDRGIIHRDLKPSNVLLAPSAAGDAGHTAYGLPKLSDFGLARSGDALHTADGAALGTPGYMAPEQAAGETARVGPAADIYALGAILYELLTGRPPFQGDTPLATLEEVRRGALVPPGQLRPELAPEVEAVVLRCLAREPNARFRTAADLANELHRLGPTGPTVDYRPPDLPGERGRRWRRWAILAVCGLAILAGAALAFWPRGGTGEQNGRPGLEPLKGSIDLRVTERNNPRRQRLLLHQPGALPLRPEDEMEYEIQVNRPAYLYLVYLDSEGNATPLFPWQNYGWKQRPAEEKRLRLFQKGSLRASPSGIESLLLLVRDDPLPAHEDLLALFAGLPKQKALPDPRARAWFENGELVRDDPDRGPPVLIGQGDSNADPVMLTQKLLQEKLRPLFPYTRAACFAFQGD